MTQSNALRWLKKHRVAVLKGGWSKERPISLKTGEAVESSLKNLGVRFSSLDVQPNIAEVLKKKKIQFCFICLHGPFGEDGRIQSLLDILRIPYTGSGAVASSLAMNKEISKVLFRESGVLTAPWVVIPKSQFEENPKAAMAPAQRLLSKTPVFIKPVDQGSAIGISKVTKKKDLFRALRSCFRTSEGALVEQFVPGRELTVGILGQQALPVVEILPVHSFYDYHSKYAKGGSRHIAPARIFPKAKKQVQKAALKAFAALGCTVVGRVDFIMRKNGQMMALEVNTIPGMTTVSLLPDAAKAAKISFDDLVCKIAMHSLENGRKN